MWNERTTPKSSAFDGLVDRHTCTHGRASTPTPATSRLDDFVVLRESGAPRIIICVAAAIAIGPRSNLHFTNWLPGRVRPYVRGKALDVPRDDLGMSVRFSLSHDGRTSPSAQIEVENACEDSMHASDADYP